MCPRPWPQSPTLYAGLNDSWKRLIGVIRHGIEMQFAFRKVRTQPELTRLETFRRG